MPRPRSPIERRGCPPQHRKRSWNGREWSDRLVATDGSAVDVVRGRLREHELDPKTAGSRATDVRGSASARGCPSDDVESEPSPFADTRARLTRRGSGAVV